jgi:hypothetical protein
VRPVGIAPRPLLPRPASKQAIPASMWRPLAPPAWCARCSRIHQLPCYAGVRTTRINCHGQPVSASACWYKSHRVGKASLLSFFVAWSLQDDVTLMAHMWSRSSGTAALKGIGRPSVSSGSGTSKTRPTSAQLTLLRVPAQPQTHKVRPSLPPRFALRSFSSLSFFLRQAAEVG